MRQVNIRVFRESEASRYTSVERGRRIDMRVYRLRRQHIFEHSEEGKEMCEYCEDR